ncbi:MAG: hypothetical protein JWN27_1937 [Candidatus Eremiobacteraeota bacterium]|nr:hypothetical protein [Candidatus Eremiobacteraeota bacterium]
MDASNRILLAGILFALALMSLSLLFLYPAYYKFIPRWLAVGTRIAFLIAAAALTVNGIFTIREGVSGVSLGMGSLLGMVIALVHRPWSERYYREERDRENASLRLRESHRRGLGE